MSKSEKYLPQAGISIARGELFNLLFTIILLSVGISIFASGASGLFVNDPIYSVLIGLFFILLPVIFFGAKLLPHTRYQRKFEGLLLTSREKNTPLEAPNYHFSKLLSGYINALEAENKAIYQRWSTEPFYKFEIDGEQGKAIKIKHNSADLAIEAIEYFFLSRLSTHLEDYFNKHNNNGYINVVTHSRRELSEFLVDNRFLDLFSKPIEDREVFSDREVSENVVFASSMGAIFDRFELKLPQGATIRRTKEGKIIINSKRMQIIAYIEFSGFHKTVPWEFCTYYMGANYRELMPHDIRINVEVNFPISSLFTVRGWEAYDWVDSFFDTIEEEFDFDSFLARIGWDNACAAVYLTRGWAQHEASNADRQPDVPLAIEKRESHD